MAIEVGAQIEARDRQDSAVQQARPFQPTQAERRFRARGRRNSKGIISFRLRELNKVRARRYGHTIPDTADGRYLARVIAVHLARGRDPDKRIASVMSLIAPWLVGACLTHLIEEVMQVEDDDSGRFVIPLPSADNLGWSLRITRAEREAWGLTTIGAIDDSSAARKRRRRLKAKEREAKRRKANGAASRAESKARTRPWEAVGMKRSTWYRRGQPAPETVSCAANLTQVHTAQSHSRLEEVIESSRVLWT